MRILLLLGLALLASCATMNEQECLKADWRLIGFEDGSQGKPQSAIGSYRKACAKASVVPELSRYQQGHLEGARQYCVRPNAYRAGVSGGAYYGICPKDLEPAFLTAYRDGQQLYFIQRDVRKLQSSIDRRQKEMDATQEQIKQHEQMIVDAKSSAKERRAALAELATLRQQLADYKVQQKQDKRALRQLERDANSLQLVHQQMGY